MSANHGGLAVSLAKLLLNRSYTIAGLRKLRYRGTAKGVAGGAFGPAGLCRRTVDGLPDDGFMKIISNSNKAVGRFLPEMSAGAALTSSRVMTAGRRLGLRARMISPRSPISGPRVGW